MPETYSLEYYRGELLNYKLDEVLDYYTEDFGEDVANEIEDKIILEIGEDNPEYHSLLERKIIHLWYELISKEIDKFNKTLAKSPNKIDFSDIIFELKSIRDKAKDSITDSSSLRGIYISDIYKIKIKIKSRFEVERNTKTQKRKDNMFVISVAVIFSIFGYILSKFF
jgi:hypothetical protein